MASSECSSAASCQQSPTISTHATCCNNLEVDGGNLEKVDKKLNGEFTSAGDRAKDLSNRIKSIDQVSKDLFVKWEKEIGDMKDRTLKTRNQQFIKRMQQTERKMQPVLQSFRDQVLFLKHNLNATAVGSLKSVASKLDGEVGILITDIEDSMKEAVGFISSLSAPKP